MWTTHFFVPSSVWDWAHMHRAKLDQQSSNFNWKLGRRFSLFICVLFGFLDIFGFLVFQTASSGHRKLNPVLTSTCNRRGNTSNNLWNVLSYGTSESVILPGRHGSGKSTQFLIGRRKYWSRKNLFSYSISPSSESKYSTDEFKYPSTRPHRRINRTSFLSISNAFEV